ncbi:biotin/lipoyl-binding protein, partial [Candidatus Kaiserbacteria bacterium]|nr:biotin/lipoyl-binding protein [Candidatus Kaiserbacteria bacterium]
MIWLFTGLLFCQSQIATAESEMKAVSVTQLRNLYLYPVKNAPAKTVSLNDARVSAEITGIVSGIKVNVGDAVKEGEPIALLDCQEHNTNLNRMRAMLDAAKAELVFSKSQFES